MKIELNHDVLTPESQAPEDLLRLKAALIMYRDQDAKRRVVVPESLYFQVAELLDICRKHAFIDVDYVIEKSIKQPYRR